MVHGSCHREKKSIMSGRDSLLRSFFSTSTSSALHPRARSFSFHVITAPQHSFTYGSSASQSYKDFKQRDIVQTLFFFFTSVHLSKELPWRRVSGTGIRQLKSNFLVIFHKMFCSTRENNNSIYKKKKKRGRNKCRRTKSSQRKINLQNGDLRTRQKFTATLSSFEKKKSPGAGDVWWRTARYWATARL